MRHLISDPAHLPISYTYAGKAYRGLSADFVLQSTEQAGNTTRYVGRLGGVLTVTVEAILYPTYGAVAYTVQMENRTDKIAPRLSDIRSLDMDWIGKDPVLSGIYGDGGADERGAYAPYAFPMAGRDATTVEMEPPTGRGTYTYFPYFHIRTAEGGLFVALGHPIIWRGVFAPTEAETETGERIPAVHIELGQARFDTALRPGESVTFPSVTLLPHMLADPDEAMNHWRHFFLDCIIRKPGGKFFPPHLSGGTSWLYAEMRDATEDNQISAMDSYLSHGVPIDYWWMDAGWYFRREGEQLNEWLETGTWLPDTNRFPTSFAAISEHGAEHGVSTLLWFEPEMARLPGEDFGPRAMDPANRLLGSPLMDMGNPAFVDWCFERFSSILDAGKISLYRQDYGVNPEAIFKHPDINPEGRVGYIENRYARGYYALWDKLMARYPGMMIDSCAAGGGRNDIDSMRRAVPLHKTDHDYSKQDDKQSMHQTLFAWLPYFGACLVGPDRCRDINAYDMQSSFAPWIALTADVTCTDPGWEAMRRYSHIWQDLNRYYTADYYPLTAWSRGDTAWRGWAFYDPATGGGFIQMFRPAGAAESSYTVRLKGLDPAVAYELWNRETDERVVRDGKSLMEKGFSVELATPQSAVVVMIAKGDR